MVDMLMTEKKSSESSITQEPQTEEGSSSAPWCDLLENSPVPTTAVNLCEVNSTDDHEAIKSSSKEKLSVFGSFQKRTLSRLSFKGESGPLLSSMMELTPPAEAAAAQPSCPSHRIHLGDGMALSGLRRAISQVSMLVVKATNSGEVAWREECLKYRQTRFSSRRVRKRVVFKHGDCNVVQGNVAKRRRRYLQDIFTTLVDAQWRWTLLVFSMNFMLSWLGFAIVWWLIVYAHGDLDPRTIAESNGTFTPCVEDIHGFTSCFLFSVETQHTIGYGSKHTTEECPEAIFVMCIQSMTGVILQAFMVGIVFAKLSRPKKRTQTLLFSRNAVICQRDGQPCLMFRVGDMRKSHIIEAHIRAQMIKRKVTREGELLPFFQTELKVGGDGEEDKIIFIWPTTIVHKIDQNSPLYHLSASDMLRERFEIIVMLEGVIESTGMTTQARSSYLPSEILWGHRFEHIITFRKETGEYEVNYTLFNNTYEVDTPLCSAAQLDDLKAIHRAKGERLSSATFPTYRDNSSSSLTTSSGSSLASSTGGLHMHAATPPTPIPVTITAPDDSPRRDSISAQVDQRLATFYTQDEEAAEYQTMARSIDDYPAEQENYNRVLEGINASLRGQRRSSIQSKEEKRIPRENSKQSLASRRNDSRANVEGMTRSPTKISMDQPSISALKKSASRVTLDSRHTRFAESPDLEFLNDHRNKPEIRQVINLIVDEEDADRNEHLKMNNLVKISSPPRSRPRPEVSDSKASNHYPLNAHPGEQV